jgi:hypothetical protein
MVLKDSIHSIKNSTFHFLNSVKLEFHYYVPLICWHVYRQVCLSLMARSEYAAIAKQGQRKLRRDSAEVHEECKSVLVYLMENMQARKINNAGIIAWKDQKCKLHFGVSDTGHWRSRGSNSCQECRKTKCETMEYVDPTPFRSFGYWEIEKSRVETLQHRSPRVTKSGIPKSRNRHINKEFCRPGNNSISESRILGVEVSKHFTTGVLKC